MCNRKPGPRCSNHGRKKLEIMRDRWNEAQALPKDSIDYITARLDYETAQHQYNCTPDGIAEAEVRASENPNDSQLQQNVILYKKEREQQMEALRELENGRVDDVASVVSSLDGFYDRKESASLIGAVRRNYERQALSKNLDADLPVDEAENRYNAVLNKYEELVAFKSGADNAREALKRLRMMAAPTSTVTLRTYADVLRALPKSQSSLRNELNRIAQLQGTSVPILQSYYDAYRDQYKNDFAHLEEKFRPDPPEGWVYGKLPKTGFVNNQETYFAPSDKASMYALYRLQVDGEAIPDHMKTSSVMGAVSVTDNGIGFTFHNRKGKTLDTYQTGEKDPAKLFVPDLANRVDGKALLTIGQGESLDILKKRLHDYGHINSPVVSYRSAAANIMNIPSNDSAMLAHLCERTQVKYDVTSPAAQAEATMKAYVTAQKKAKSTWNAQPARKNAPIITHLPLSSRWK